MSLQDGRSQSVDGRTLRYPVCMPHTPASEAIYGHIPSHFPLVCFGMQHESNLLAALIIKTLCTARELTICLFLICRDLALAQKEVLQLLHESGVEGKQIVGTALSKQLSMLAKRTAEAAQNLKCAEEARDKVCRILPLLLQPPGMP